MMIDLPTVRRPDLAQCVRRRCVSTGGLLVSLLVWGPLHHQKVQGSLLPLIIHSPECAPPGSLIVSCVAPEARDEMRFWSCRRK